MNLEEFLAAVEAAPSEPLKDREKIALGRMLSLGPLSAGL